MYDINLTSKKSFFFEKKTCVSAGGVGVNCGKMRGVFAVVH